MRAPLAILLLLTALAARAADGPDPRVWVLEGEELRARHADTLDEILREVPGLRLRSFAGDGSPFLLSPGLGAGPLLLLDGLPLRDPWSGENLYGEVPLSMVERVEVDLGSSVLAYGGRAAAGVIRVTTRRHDGMLSRAGLHVSPLMIGEPVSKRFSLESPPGGLALALSLDEYRGGPAGTSDRRALLTRMSLDGGTAGPMEFQLLQCRGHRSIDESENSDSYALSLAMPQGPWGDWRIRQSFRGRDRESRELGLSCFELHWNSRSEALDSLGISSFVGMEIGRPELKDIGQERERLPAQGRAWLALSRFQGLPLGLSSSLGMRLELPRQGEAALQGEARVSRPLERRPMRLEVWLAGGRSTPAWDRDRLEGLDPWTGSSTLPASGQSADFLRAGLSLGAWTDQWRWTFGYWTETGELWALEHPEEGAARWVLDDTGRRGGLAFGSGAEIPFLRSALDLGTRQIFRLMGAGDHRFKSRLTGSLDLQWEMDEREMARPLRLRTGLEYRRDIAKGDGHWRLSLPLEWRGGGEAEDLVTLDFSAELRVLSGRIWFRSRNLLGGTREEIAGYGIDGGRTRIGVDWILYD